MRTLQMVAAYHSLVGLAAAVTSIANIMLAADSAHGALDGVHMTTAFLGDVIGAITLTGSVSHSGYTGSTPGKLLQVATRTTITNTTHP